MTATPISSGRGMGLRLVGFFVVSEDGEGGSEDEEEVEKDGARNPCWWLVIGVLGNWGR